MYYNYFPADGSRVSPPTKSAAGFPNFLTDEVKFLNERVLFTSLHKGAIESSGGSVKLIFFLA